MGRRGRRMRIQGEAQYPRQNSEYLVYKQIRAVKTVINYSSYSAANAIVA